MPYFSPEVVTPAGDLGVDPEPTCPPPLVPLAHLLHGPVSPPSPISQGELMPAPNTPQDLPKLLVAPKPWIPGPVAEL